MANQTCNTCTKPVGQPFRRHDQTGRIVHGCVDASHTESLQGIISESSRWHFRKEAKAIRLATARHLRQLKA